MRPISRFAIELPVPSKGGGTPLPIRLLRIIALVSLLFVVLANCGSAFLYPLELEAREGTSWLYVLANRAGVNIYDHGHVFVNMNHGPVDPLLKNIAGRFLPFLGPMMITRCFAVLVPAGLWLAMIGAVRGRPLDALIWALGLEILLLGLWPVAFLVGRSDPCAIFFLGLLLWAAAGARELAGRERTAWLSRVAGMGAFGATCVLANWRFAPAVAGVFGAFAIENLLAVPVQERSATLCQYGVVLFAAAGISTALVFAAAYGTHWSLYYHRSIEFFGKNGASFQPGRFTLLPLFVFRAHLALHFFALVAAALAAVFPSMILPRRTQLLVWWPFIALLWMASDVAYWLNWNAGTVIYFGSFYVVSGFFLARAIDWRRCHFPLLRFDCAESDATVAEVPGGKGGNASRHPIPLGIAASFQAISLAGLFFSLPWTPALRQGIRLSQEIVPARKFLEDSRTLAAGAGIHSEDCYSFEAAYAGEKLDMGDIVSALAKGPYFDGESKATIATAFAQLHAHPPEFVMSDGFPGPELGGMLDRSYRPLLRSEPVDVSGVPQLSLYALNSVSPPPAARNLPPSASSSARSLFAGALRRISRLPLISWLQSRNDDFSFIVERESGRLADANREILGLQRELGQSQDLVVQTQQAVLQAQAALVQTQAALVRTRAALDQSQAALNAKADPAVERKF